MYNQNEKIIACYAESYITPPNRGTGDNSWRGISKHLAITKSLFAFSQKIKIV